MSPRGAGYWVALPDALTALAFVLVWRDPFVFGELSVKTAMLTMLVEFFLVHATGFFTAIANQPRSDWKLRVFGLGGLSLFYLLMIGGFAWSFGQWWPLLAFGWLVVGKVFWILRSAPASDDDTFVQMAAWAGSVVAYLGACFATVVPEVPRWGILPELQPRFGFDAGSGGLWIDEPQRVVAFGALYFALLCIGKLATARWPLRAPGA